MKNLMLALAIGFAVAGCASSPLTTDVDYDTTMDFAAQKTFAWMPPTGNAVANELLVNRIRSSVDQQLQAKGRAPAAGNPNFLIAMDLSGKTAYGEPGLSPEEQQKRIDGVIAQMLAQFPPKK